MFILKYFYLYLYFKGIKLLLFHIIMEITSLFQLSEISGIEADDIEFAKGKGTFPFDMSVVDINSDLDWSIRSGPLDQRPLYILDDGAMVYYRYLLFLLFVHAASESSETWLEVFLLRYPHFYSVQPKNTTSEYVIKCRKNK